MPACQPAIFAFVFPSLLAGLLATSCQHASQPYLLSYSRLYWLGCLLLHASMPASHICFRIPVFTGWVACYFMPACQPAIFAFVFPSLLAGLLATSCQHASQ